MLLAHRKIHHDVFIVGIWHHSEVEATNYFEDSIAARISPTFASEYAK
jgi:hypothetical protein